MATKPSRVVLDASALLALMLEEPGGEAIRPLLGNALISAVNLSETMVRLSKLGFAQQETERWLFSLSLVCVAFDQRQAFLAARLTASTARRGLSFGDRACLALGLLFGLPVMTADHAWEGLVEGLEVRLIR